MATTPPPIERASTPPTPLHGPMFDSPRRSSRIHSRQSNVPGNVMDSPPATTSNRKRPAARPTSHQALSPPSSPTSPQHRQRNSSHKTSRTTAPLASASRPSHAARLGIEEASKMYPTPSKTPRKRVAHKDFGNTARVLFHDRETNPDDIMPTPSKSKKGAKHTAFSLESFEEERNGRDKVQIYTDSAERVPELTEEEDNPFVMKKSAAKPHSNGSGKAHGRVRGRPKHGMSKRVDEAVEDDKGIVYTFRGKKVFRKFDDDSDGNALNDDEDPAAVFSDQDLLRHQAGAASRKRLTRSSIKPRLLFPPKNAESTHDPQPEDPNEATTDIETPADAHDDPDTPQDQSFGIGTPPATEDKKKKSPFDSWPRTKSGRTGKTKRPGSPLERGQAADKRSRSAQPST